MPNWCSNDVEITGDEESISQFEQFLEEKKGKEWFDFFLPRPKDEEETWYEWSIENWGCKWNCDAHEWERIDNTIRLVFDSPWSAPVKLYEYISNNDFDVEANYWEEGIGFVGRFSDGYDECYEYELDDPESLDNIPEELVEYWDLRSRQEDYLNEMNDEENDDE